MKSSENNNLDVAVKKSFSKIDSSGTDPNRYAEFDSKKQSHAAVAVKNKEKSKSFIPGLKINVSKTERVLVTVAGLYLLYKALSSKKTSSSKTLMGASLLFRGASGYCPMYDAVDQVGNTKGSNINIRTVISINKPVNEVYDFWRKLENLPKFMSHLLSINEIDNITSEWKAKGPLGIGSISWKAHILMDEKGSVLSWKSLPNSTIDNAGKVTFKDAGDNATELDVIISYKAPLGIAGEAAAKLFNPLFQKMVKEDIENLKIYLETGKNIEENK